MPNYRIVVLPSAEVDMQEIFDYIAQDNKQKALEIIDITNDYHHSANCFLIKQLGKTI